MQWKIEEAENNVSSIQQYWHKKNRGKDKKRKGKKEEKKIKEIRYKPRPSRVTQKPIN